MDKNIEANFDILYLLNYANKSYPELHRTEINSLGYLSFLLSIYDGYKTNDWGYRFTYHKYGGPDSSEITKEIESLVSSHIISDDERDYYKLSNLKLVNKKLSYISNSTLMKWRTKYLEASINACMTRSLPLLEKALDYDPAIKSARDTDKRIVINNDYTIGAFDYLSMLKKAIGDNRDQILIPASVWIDYLLKLYENDSLKEGYE